MQKLLSFFTAYARVPVLLAAVNLGVPEALESGPKTSAELAPLLKVNNVEKLSRFLNAVATAGIFDVEEGGKYKLNEVSVHLIDKPGTVGFRWFVLLGQEPSTIGAHDNLANGILTDKCPFELANNAPIFEYYKNAEKAAVVFYNAMTAISSSAGLITSLVNKLVSFADSKIMVDVGGGHGFISSSILRANPHVSGTVYDLHEVVAAANAKKKTLYADLEGRLEFVGGDFFKEVPAGDTYILKHIIHDWDDAKALKILQNIYRAMSTNGKLLLIDCVIKEHDLYGASQDMLMLVLCDGKERTEKQWKELLTAVGFSHTKFTALTPTPFFVIETSKDE